MSPPIVFQQTLFLLTAYLFQHTLSQPQCLTIWVTFDFIDSSLDATDWAGTYTTTGSNTTNGCLIYSTSSGASLEYHGSSWSLHSPSNDIITYTTTPTNPCNPPLTPNETWTHGLQGVADSRITITCSMTSPPTIEPTSPPTYEPTIQPTTSSPTEMPSQMPTTEPTWLPTTMPTTIPSNYPSVDPTDAPTMEPTYNPTGYPSIDPTTAPSVAPVTEPTIAPHEVCSKITVAVQGGVPKIQESIIDGVYYQQDVEYLGTPGYPYYIQYKSDYPPEETYHIIIAFLQGEWTILDSVHKIELKYSPQYNAITTLHVPPHTIGHGDHWIEIKGENGYLSEPPYYLWAVLITCDEYTTAPTETPTYEPTGIPSQLPTMEPTRVPTTAKPTFVPTQEPTAETTENTSDAAASGDGFLDSMSVIEWLIIACIPLLCCLIIGSLYMWRNKEIQKAIDKDAAHNLSANSPSDDERMMAVEMASPKRNTQLNFGGSHKRQSTADIEANFADALAVVSKHKAQNSTQNKYETVDAQSPEIASPSTAPVSEMVPIVPSTPNQTQQPLIDKRDSEFYGNHPIDEIYSYTFITKPFGMEWKTTKSDKKNLYVSKVQKDSQAKTGNVLVGSRLISFNGEMIEDLGAKQIYGKLALSDMPLTITFLRPHKKEMDKEGDNYGKANKNNNIKKPKPQLAKRDTTPPAPHSANVSEIPPDAIPAQYVADDNKGNVPLIPPKVPADYNNDDNDDNKEAENNNNEYEEDPFAAMEIGPSPITPVFENEEVAISPAKTSIMTKAQALIPEVFAEEDEQVDTQESFHAD